MDNPADKVLVVDSDLEGVLRPASYPQEPSLGLCIRRHHGAQQFFGCRRIRFGADRQGIFGTFSAFLEMVISEITMARLNQANVLAHFSHAGVDDMADNTCHFGINNFFADNGLADGDTTRLYFPADALQLRAMLPGFLMTGPAVHFFNPLRHPVYRE